MSLLKGNVGKVLVALVSTILSSPVAAKLFQHIIPIAREFADQLVTAMNLSKIVRPFVWLGSVVLVLLIVIFLVALLCRLITPKPSTKTA